MSDTFTDTETVTVRLARTQEEIEAAQRLRYHVFYEEYGAKPDELVAQLQRDFDQFDEHADHLIVLDSAQSADEPKIVGTYRMLRREGAEKCGKFYSSTEYDLANLIDSDAVLLELGRSCVLHSYRNRPVLQLLWQGIADYFVDNKIDLMFGCASLHSTDINELSAQLSYLYHYHLAPEELCARALDDRYINMNILPKEAFDAKAVFNQLPPLIKGYLRVGSMVGDGAVIDPQFNTTDVFVVARTKMVTDRYRRHYERRIQKTIPAEAEIDGKSVVETALSAAAGGAH